MEENSGISDQLMQIIKHLNLDREKFSREIGSTGQTIANIVHGANPGFLTILKIHNRFPEINMNWLLFKEGAMLVDTESSFIENRNQNADQDKWRHQVETLQSEIKLLHQIVKDKEEIIQVKNELIANYKSKENK